MSAGSFFVLTFGLYCTKILKDGIIVYNYSE